jgi:hypothetical protein
MQSSSAKVALITGANKGIGFEIARALGKAGCVVLLGARNPELGRAAASKLQAEDLNVRFVALDLERPETIRDAAVLIRKEFQRLDILDQGELGRSRLHNDGFEWESGPPDRGRRRCRDGPTRAPAFRWTDRRLLRKKGLRSLVTIVRSDYEKCHVLCRVMRKWHR